MLQADRNTACRIIRSVVIELKVTTFAVCEISCRSKKTGYYKTRILWYHRVTECCWFCRWNSRSDPNTFCIWMEYINRKVFILLMFSLCVITPWKLLTGLFAGPAQHTMRRFCQGVKFTDIFKTIKTLAFGESGYPKLSWLTTQVLAPVSDADHI